ncbi:MAG: GTP-binding protein [Xanthomonadales bacterium]|nr:GTP-binding protein [Xanthomonadales bacterium]
MTDPRTLATDSLRALLADPTIPAAVREELAAEFAEIEALLGKLERDEVHVAVLGRVSVGKSALLNALLGQERFAVDVLHGTTTTASAAGWQEAQYGRWHLIDTPGINELSGEERERHALAVADRADVILFVCDGDLTATELAALVSAARAGRPMLLVLNKADRYTRREREELLAHLKARVADWIPAELVVAAAARPAPRTLIRVDAAGHEQESRETPAVDVMALQTALEGLLAREGRTLSAVNAGLAASRVSDRLGERLLEVRRVVAERLIRSYALGKGVAVGLTPVPVADVAAAAGMDVLMVLHLSRVYGLGLTRVEAGQLLGTIAAQLALLLGAAWGVHVLSSALKGVTAGLSTLLTAGVQGAVAYVATYITGRAADRYLANGKSWGSSGPKTVVAEILDGLDREQLLKDARAEILKRLKAGA